MHGQQECNAPVRVSLQVEAAERGTEFGQRANRVLVASFHSLEELDYSRGREEAAILHNGRTGALHSVAARKAIGWGLAGLAMRYYDTRMRSQWMLS